MALINTTIKDIIMATDILSADRLREVAKFNPDTGVFIRIESVANIHAGSVMGCAAKNGYLRARVDGTLYYIHRLAWLYMNGSWPDSEIDHKDGDRANNRWVNLRSANRAENKQNISSKTFNLSGVRNVYHDKKSGKWQVKIMKGYKSKSFGYFKTIEEASNAAFMAKRLEHKFNPEFVR